MKKQALALVACLIFVALFAGIAATSASANPGLGACTGCHNAGGSAPVVTETANDGTNATFTISAPGAAGWAVFQGSTRLGGSEGSDAYPGATDTGGTFTVHVGATYTIYAGTAQAIGVATVSPTSSASSFTVTPTAGAHGAISPSTPQTVAKDGSITFTFTPDAGYVVADVLVDGASKGASSSYTISNVNANATIEVQFAQATVSYTITASAGANGAVDPTGAQTVASGADKTFTITPNAGYYPQVKIDGQAVALFRVGGVYAYTFTNVADNHEIDVTFAASPTFCAITATVGPGGTIIPDSPNPYNLYPGSTITYAFLPDAGYHVDHVIVNGTPVTLTDDEFTFEAVDQNYTLAVTFAQNTYTITATADAHGSITPAGATQVIEGNDSPAYAMAAASGYHVTGVTVDGVSVGIQTTYTFQDVTEDHTIAVTTAADAGIFSITPTAGIHGTITPAAPFMVTSGSSVTFFFMPDEGYTVGAVTVDGQVQSPIDVMKDDFSYTFENVSANHTIAVTFVQVATYTITPTCGAHGWMSPDAAQTVVAGDSVSYTITPEAGYHIADVLVDGQSKGAIESYEFTEVAANHTISASFAWTKLSTSTTLKASAKTIKRNGYVTLTATLKGGTFTNTTIRFEVKVGNKSYKLLKTVKVSSTGVAKYRYKVTASGTRYHRVRFLGNATYLPSPLKAGIKLVVR